MILDNRTYNLNFIIQSIRIHPCIIRPRWLLDRWNVCRGVVKWESLLAPSLYIFFGLAGFVLGRAYIFAKRLAGRRYRVLLSKNRRPHTKADPTFLPPGSALLHASVAAARVNIAYVDQLRLGLLPIVALIVTFNERRSRCVSSLFIRSCRNVS